MSLRPIWLGNLKIVKFATRMRLISSRVATALLCVVLFNGAAGLMASAVLPGSGGCPHHASSQECSMAKCPMRHADPASKAEATMKLVWPTGLRYTGTCEKCFRDG